MKKRRPKLKQHHTLSADTQIKHTLSAEIKNAESKESGLLRSKLSAYTGKPVNLPWYTGFDAPVVYNTATANIKNSVPYLEDHRTSSILGHTENLSVNNGQIEGEAVYSYPSEKGKEIHTAIENGLPMQASIGVEIQSEEDITYHKKGETFVVNGKTLEGPMYTIDNWTLSEVSATLFGRDDETSITKLSKDSIMRIKNSKDVTPKPPADKTASAPTPTPVSLYNSKDLFKLMRLSANEEEEKLVEEGMDKEYPVERIIEQVKLHRYNNSQPAPPSPGNKEQSAQQFACRMALGLGVEAEYLEKKFDKEVVGKSFDQGPMGLREMLTLSANANGGNFSGHGNDILNVCEYHKTLKNTNQYSTINFPNLLNTVVQMKMEEHWGIGESWAQQNLLKQSQSSFKPTVRIRPSGGRVWTVLDNDGRIEHGTAGEEKVYTTELHTIAQIMTFKRADIINDDLGVLQESIALMMEGATMAPDLLFVKKLYEGIGSFLTAGKGNLGTGSGVAFSEAALKAAYDAVRQREVKKGDKSVKTNFNTKWTLVIPQALEQEVWDIVEQPTIVSNTTANTKQGSRNYWYKRLDVKVFHNLDNSTYHAKADPTNWMIIPQRPMLAPYSLTFLNNQNSPTTETVDLPADMLGYGVRGYWDLDVNEREDETVYLAMPQE